jgi:aconitate hydratase 2/2-methylisocitrate dehydratase
MTDIGVVNANGDKIYQYMNFDKIQDFKQVADTVEA